MLFFAFDKVSLICRFAFFDLIFLNCGMVLRSRCIAFAVVRFDVIGVFRSSRMYIVEVM